MIQRIQSVYLLMIAVLNGILFFTPIAKIIENKEVMFFLCGIKNMDNSLVFRNYPLIVLNIVSILFTVFVIFQFKNRKFQIKLTKILLGILLILVASVYVLYPFIVFEKIFGKINVSFTYSFIIFAFSLLFNVLALKAIKKDDEKVRSADRIR